MLAQRRRKFGFHVRVSRGGDDKALRTGGDDCQFRNDEGALTIVFKCTGYKGKGKSREAFSPSNARPLTPMNLGFFPQEIPHASGLGDRSIFPGLNQRRTILPPLPGPGFPPTDHGLVADPRAYPGGGKQREDWRAPILAGRVNKINPAIQRRDRREMSRGHESMLIPCTSMSD